MIRTLNIAFIAVTGLLCLGLYRIAEEARVAEADLKATRAAIAYETDALSVLGAEWARLTQPGRIQALVQKHLNLTDKPAPQLSGLTDLPLKALPPEEVIRNANAELPVPAEPAKPETPPAESQPASEPGFAALHTGT